jgi:hypothetical protein
MLKIIAKLEAHIQGVPSKNVNLRI